MLLLSQLHAPPNAAAVQGASQQQPVPRSQEEAPNVRLAHQALELLDRLGTPQGLLVGGEPQAAAAGSSPMLTPLAWMLQEQINSAWAGPSALGTAVMPFHSPCTALLGGLAPPTRLLTDGQLPVALMNQADMARLLEQEDWSIDALFGCLPISPAPNLAAGLSPLAGTQRQQAACSPLPTSGTSTQLALSGSAVAVAGQAEASAPAAVATTACISPLPHTQQHLGSAGAPAPSAASSGALESTTPPPGLLGSASLDPGTR